MTGLWPFPGEFNSLHLGSESEFRDFKTTSLLEAHQGMSTEVPVRKRPQRKLFWVRGPTSGTFQTNSSQAPPKKIDHFYMEPFYVISERYSSVQSQIFSSFMYSKIIMPASGRSLVKYSPVRYKRSPSPILTVKLNIMETCSVTSIETDYGNTNIME